jgi:adenosylcobinamide-GDP ribazoletransferase
VPWFAPVGIVLGLLLGGVWRGLTAVGPPLLAATLVVAADVVLTGGLHLDGLADTADGLVPPLPRARRLAIMRDPATGAFGAAALTLVLVLRVAALSAFATGRPWMLAAVWCAARGATAFIVRTQPYARPKGLASGLAAGGIVVPAVVGALLTIAAALVDAPRALVAVAVTVATASGAQWFARRRLGGYTGDTHGAGIVLGETAGLVAAALL